jgi:hypothetical protein
MMWFWDCDFKRLSVQQIINEAAGGIPCLKASLPDSQLFEAAHKTSRSTPSCIIPRFRLEGF